MPFPGTAKECRRPGGWGPVAELEGKHMENWGGIHKAHAQGQPLTVWSPGGDFQGRGAPERAHSPPCLGEAASSSSHGASAKPAAASSLAEGLAFNGERAHTCAAQ